MWKKVRKFFNDLHLWMGLASGLIVIAVCFSGTIYVFNTELREMAAPELYNIQHSEEAFLTAEKIIEKVEAETGGKVLSIKIPADKERAWHISVKKEEIEMHGKTKNLEDNRVGKEGREAGLSRSEPAVKEDKTTTAKDYKGESKPAPPQGGTSGRPNMGTSYAVNPYSAEILGDVSNNKNATTEFLKAMFSLHRWLLLDRIEEPVFGELPNRKLGSYITGTATILFTLGVLTGLVIWFPQKLKSWKQGFKIKWRANWKRVNHDLHNALAFYALIFLFLMGITGPQWSFPWYREGLQKTLDTYSAPDTPRPKQPGSVMPAQVTQKTAIGDYIISADNALPYRGDYTIVLPADSASAVSVTKNKLGFFAPSASDKLLLDQYTASVLSTDIFVDKPFNERVAGSIKAIHLGDVYGMFSKILYFFACLIATSLPVTGTIIWINKLKKKKHKSLKKEKAIHTFKVEI